jgi:hypothetical protein
MRDGGVWLVGGNGSPVFQRQLSQIGEQGDHAAMMSPEETEDDLEPEDAKLVSNLLTN